MIDPVQERRPPISPQMALRVAILGGVALALFAIVFFRLWYLQVLSGDQYLAEANNNQVREQRVQAPRGEIVDRYGNTIVTNKRAIVVEIDPAKLPEAERALAARWGQLAGRREKRPKGRKGAPVEIPPIPTAALERRYERLANVLGDTSARAIHRQVVRSLSQVPYARVRVKTDVPRSVMNYIKERQERFPGVDVQQSYLRRYPRTTLAAQMLGTVGEVSPRQLKRKRFRGVKQGTIVGQEGLELQYDRYLRGQDGINRISVDAFGRPNPRDRLPDTDPRAGQRLRMTIDLDLQKAGQAALTSAANAGGNPAAFVALNPENGEILAMGSYPSFDPNDLTRPLTQRRYEQLFGEQAGAPRYNRAIGGLYPTGSTFKPLTSIAALETGVVTPETVISDPGCIRIGTRQACNAGKVVNGPVALRKALQVSSDVYFYRLGQSLFDRGGATLQKWAKRLGLGRRTGVDLPGEFKGLLPDQRWRTRLNEEERRCRPGNGGKPCYAIDIRPYNVGDNVNLAVGQGELQATPLQMAVAYSTIVTGGRVPRPHVGMEVEDRRGRLMQRIRREPARRVKIDPGHRQAVMDGLRLAAGAPGGTSTDVFKDWPRDLPVYGKTGTAERLPKPDQSWYVAYVPRGRGKSPIVVAATVEFCGCFGAEAAAPITRLILSEHFGIKKKVVRGSSHTR